MNPRFVPEIQRLRDKVVKLQQTNDQLNERVVILDALEAAGVDNWEGYDTAMEGVT